MAAVRISSIKRWRFESNGVLVPMPDGKQFVPAVNTGDMTRQEWQAFRSSYKLLGGSAIGTIMGLDEYKSPLQLWREYIGLTPAAYTYNKYMANGHIDELGILQRLAHWNEATNDWVESFANERVERCVDQWPYTFFPDHLPWGAFNVDGIITEDRAFPGEFGVAEAKTIGKQVASKYKEGVPPKYICQGVSYMMALGATFGRFAFLDTDRDFYSMVLVKGSPEYNELSTLLEERCAEFFDCMVKGIEILEDGGQTKANIGRLMDLERSHSAILRIDASLSTAKYLNDVQKERDGIEMEGTIFDRILDERAIAKENEDMFSERRTELDNAIRLRMQQLGCSTYKAAKYKINYNGRLTITHRR